MLIFKKVQVSAHDNAVLAYPACGDGVLAVEESLCLSGFQAIIVVNVSVF